MGPRPSTNLLHAILFKGQPTAQFAQMSCQYRLAHSEVFFSMSALEHFSSVSPPGKGLALYLGSRSPQSVSYPFKYSFSYLEFNWGMFSYLPLKNIKFESSGFYCFFPMIKIVECYLKDVQKIP